MDVKFLVFTFFIVTANAGDLKYASYPAAQEIAYAAPDYGYTEPALAHSYAPVAETHAHAYAPAPVAYAAPAAVHAAPIAYAAPIAKTVVAEPSAPAHYDFGYAVNDPHTGDQKSQQESRRGDVVRGSYSVVDADGTKRTVEYAADAHNGFNAVVHKEPAAVAVKAVAPVAPVAHVAAAAPVSYAAPIAAAPVHAAPISYSPAITYAAHAAPADDHHGYY